MKLNVADARNLLNSRTPLIFILVSLEEDGASEVRHRLVDGDFSNELATFVAGSTTEMEVRAHDCSGEEAFDSDLRTCLSHGYSETIRLGLAERRLLQVLPSASVEIRRNGQGQLTVVETVHMFDYYDSNSPEQERAIVHAAFGSLEHGSERFLALTPKPEVLKYVRNLPGPTVLAGYLEESEVVLRCSSALGHFEAGFVVRRTRTHWAYVHSSGLSLIVSHPRRVDGRRVHETEVFVDPLVDTKLEDLGTFADFLSACGPGSTIVKLDSTGNPDGTGFATDIAFVPMHTVARFIDGWRRCFNIDGWPERAVSLRDVTDAEVFHSLTGLAAMLTDERVIARYSFYLAATDDEPGVDGFVQTPVHATLPVIVNLATNTVVVRFRVNAWTLSRGGDVCGMKFRDVDGASAEVLSLIPKSTIYPEAVYGGNDTTTAFGPSLIEGLVPAELRDIALAWEEPDGNP